MQNHKTQVERANAISSFPLFSFPLFPKLFGPTLTVLPGIRHLNLHLRARAARMQRLLPAEEGDDAQPQSPHIALSLGIPSLCEVSVKYIDVPKWRERAEAVSEAC